MQVGRSSADACDTSRLGLSQLTASERVVSTVEELDLFHVDDVQISLYRIGAARAG